MRLLAISFAGLTTLMGISVSVQAEGQCSTLTYARIAYASNCKAETGYSYLPPIASPTQDQLKLMCATSSCKTMIQQLTDAFPVECSLGGTPLRATLIDPFNKACGPAPPSASCGNDQIGAQSCPSGQYCQPWNPTDYQCRTIDAKCGVQQVGVEISGDDLATQQLVLPEDCCKACSITVGCTGYTFVNYNPDGKAYCYLKKGPGVKTPKTGAVSATMGQAAAKCSPQLANIDLYGEDLSAVYGVSMDECCSQCGVTTGCKGYTYVTSEKACYLKASNVRVKEGVVSALLI